MLIFPVPAKYLAEVESSVRDLVLRTRMDDQSGGGIIDAHKVDAARIGTVLVMVADLATDDANLSIAEVARARGESRPAFVRHEPCSLGLTV